MKCRARHIGAVACAIVGCSVAIAPTADAAATTSLVGAMNTSGSKTMSAACASVVGVATSLSSVDFAIEVHGTAAASDGSVPVAVAATCDVIDAASGATLGVVSGGFPGPVVEQVSVISIPLTSDPYVCVGGTALFSDGGSVTINPSSHCAPVPPEAIQQTIDQRLKCPVGCPGP